MQGCAGSSESEQGYHHNAEVWLDNPGVCPLKSLVCAGSSKAVCLAVPRIAKTLITILLAAFLAEGFIILLDVGTKPYYSTLEPTNGYIRLYV